MKILIVGYGNIGKHIYEEFKTLTPDIYDPFIADFAVKSNNRYDVAFICVPTDMLPDGKCDTSIVEQTISETDADVIVIKSTIPPQTTNRLISGSGKNIIFSPEYYGVTQHSKRDPGFVILGGEKPYCELVAQAYYRVKNGNYKFYFTETVTAELAKYMENCFLALKVTFCNEFACIAEKFGVNYSELRELFVADERIGASHTFVYKDKPYYESHCLNKDIPALINFADGQAPLMRFMNELNTAKKKLIKKENNVSNQCEKHLKNDKVGEILKKYACGDSYNVKMPKPNINTTYKYYCSICLIIRDENEYLEEWLKWHLAQGVQHFYIYDNGSKESVKEFVQSLGEDIAKNVTVIDWSGSHVHAQCEAYNECLRKYGSENKWIGFIDVDEQVRVKNGLSLPEFLQQYEAYAGIMAVWILYGANGYKLKSDLPLRERFNKPIEMNIIDNKMGKVFVQPPFIEEMFIHNCQTLDGYYVVDEYKNMIYSRQIYSDEGTKDLICVDHYYTKSYEEWIEKLKRGTGDSNYSRSYDEFFRLNPDMEYCREDHFPIQEYEKSSKETQKATTVVNDKETYYVCAIIKDEHEYIREWVLYNLSIGFDKIVLYDNNSSKSYDAELGDLISDGVVEIRIWNETGNDKQINAYNNFVHSGQWGKNDFCAFIDPDEFIFFDNVKSVAEFMRSYLQYSGVGLSWKTYNANGRIEKPKNIPTPEAYTTEIDLKEPRIKVIARLKMIDIIYSPHAFKPIDGCPPLITTGGEVIVDQSPEYIDYKNGHIKHYFTKSWEDWVKRLKRGNITKGLRTVETFFKANPDMINLQEILTQDLDYGEFPTMN